MNNQKNIVLSVGLSRRIEQAFKCHHRLRRLVNAGGEVAAEILIN